MKIGLLGFIFHLMVVGALVVLIIKLFVVVTVIQHLWQPLGLYLRIFGKIYKYFFEDEMVNHTRNEEVSAEELEDVRNVIAAHAYKWNRTDGMACAVFAEFLKQMRQAFHKSISNKQL